MQPIWQDMRYGTRMLLKQSGFTLIAVLTPGWAFGALALLLAFAALLACLAPARRATKMDPLIAPRCE